MEYTLEQVRAYFYENLYQVGYTPNDELKRVKNTLTTRYSNLCELWQKAVREDYQDRLNEVDFLLAGGF